MSVAGVVWPWLVLLFVLFVLYSRLEDPWWSLLELVTLAVARLTWPDAPGVSFIGFYLSKFIVSALFFYYQHQVGRHSNKPRIFYIFGFAEDPVHGGLYARGSLYDYSERKANNASSEADRSFPHLRASVLAYDMSKLTKAAVVQFVAYAHGAAIIVERLKLSGRCHNWAAVKLYEMSTDKFFSFVLLHFLRWDMWIGFSLSSLLGAYALIEQLVQRDASGVSLLIDCVFLFIAVLDALNLEPRRVNLHPERRRRSLKRSQVCHWLEGFVKYALVFGLQCLVAVVSPRSPYCSCGPLFLWFALVLAVYVACHGMRMVGVQAPPQEPPQRMQLRDTFHAVLPFFLNFVPADKVAATVVPVADFVANKATTMSVGAAEMSSHDAALAVTELSQWSSTKLKGGEKKKKKGKRLVYLGQPLCYPDQNGV